MKARHLLAIAPAIALSACASLQGGTPAPAAAATISVAVGPCFGFCPVYEVRIAPAGEIVFTGLRHTAVVGERRRSIAVSAYRAIARDLAPFRPATTGETPVPCEAAITDTSRYTITWIDPDGGTVVATHQSGCSGGPGRALDIVLRSLPTRLGIKDWARQVTRPGSGRG